MPNGEAGENPDHDGRVSCGVTVGVPCAILASADVATPSELGPPKAKPSNPYLVVEPPTGGPSAVPARRSRRAPPSGGQARTAMGQEMAPRAARSAHPPKRRVRTAAPVGPSGRASLQDADACVNWAWKISGKQLGDARTEFSGVPKAKSSSLQCGQISRHIEREEPVEPSVVPHLKARH